MAYRMWTTFQIQHSENLKLFLKKGSTSVLSCILHLGLNIVVRKIQWWIMLPHLFIDNNLLIVNSKYWQEVKIIKIESFLKVCPECMLYSFESIFWEFWIQFFILQKKTKMAKIMFTIFQIQHRQISNYL
jgi:hypothetical protein